MNPICQHCRQSPCVCDKERAPERPIAFERAAIASSVRAWLTRHQGLIPDRAFESLARVTDQIRAGHYAPSGEGESDR